MAGSSPDQFGTSPETREQMLRDARQRLARLEIETHRLRAELARLEAAGEDEAARALAKRLETEEAKLAATPQFELPEAADSQPKSASRGKNKRPGRPQPANSVEPEAARPVLDQSVVESADKSKRRKWLRGLPAWSVSLAAHVAFLLALMLVTFAIQQDQRQFLLSNAVDGEDAFDDFSEISLEAPRMELEEFSEELEPSELTDSLVDDLEVTLDAAALGLDMETPAALDALPTDIAGMMVGELGGGAEGAQGAGKKAGGGSPAGAKFFGARSRGNRFVFVVDNSGTMKDGRMETTILELLRSVRSMKPDQQFHVLFHSDQVYPMFFPEPVDELLPATRENRQRLEQWLTTIEMAKGSGLREALDYAAELDPHVVYVLNDGSFLFLDRNGQRTMSSTLKYLTQDTGDWPFTIHTLGMTVRDRDDAEALMLIAQAHGGNFTPVGISPGAAQIARQVRRPYHNEEPGRTWGSKVRAR